MAELQWKVEVRCVNTLLAEVWVGEGGEHMMVSVPDAKEVLLSGRLTRIPALGNGLEQRLSKYAPVHKPRREARTAKEAAEGARMLGEGILGGEYEGIVESLEIRHSSGTMYDHVRCSVSEDL